MDTIKIEEQMKEWFLHFDLNTEKYKLKHLKDFDLSKFTFKEVKKGVDSNVETDKQKEGARKS